MDTQNFDTLAEISIALIGFAGVVGALGRSRLPSEVLSMRLRMLFASGSMALWGSLCPVFATEMASPSSAGVVAAVLYAPPTIALNRRRR